jgi:hypothetical protein
MWFKNTKTTFDGVYKTYKKTAGAKSQYEYYHKTLSNESPSGTQGLEREG